MNIDFNMTADYCSDWTAIDAIREITQNAIDSGKRYTCDIKAGAVYIRTYGVTLPIDVFSLGVSHKSADSIGKYGEGFKLAMMVLTRLGHEPEIYSGDQIISGKFLVNSVTGVPTFNLVFTQTTRKNTDNLIFMCELEDIDPHELEHKVTPFADDPLPRTHGVEILYTRPGDIYVQGLWVCHDDSLTYGYNFAPGKISLNRDRNMVDGVQWQLGQYYGNLGSDKASVIFNLIKHEARDVADLSYHLDNKDLQAELARLFFNEYGNGATIARPGGGYIGNGFVSMGYSGYRTMHRCGVTEAKKSIDPKSPTGQLQAFLAKHRNKLRRDTRQEFEALITHSKGWKEGL